MDGNSWRGGQVPMGQPQGGAVEESALSSSGGAPIQMEPDDWRSQLPLDSRHRVVNKIMETLKKHLPFSGQEGLLELKKIAVRFEEKIYSAATSQSDYLRKIALKMLTMETKYQGLTANSLQTNTANASRNPSDLGGDDELVNLWSVGKPKPLTTDGACKYFIWYNDANHCGQNERIVNMSQTIEKLERRVEKLERENENFRNDLRQSIQDLRCDNK